MQFHLNGFRPGDPAIALSTREDEGRQGTETLPDSVDVLIVGSGPAGLTLAAQLAAFPDIRTCIIDQKAGPMEIGQADGIACRTMEMFEAFGFAEKVMKEAYWVNETAFWGPDPDEPSNVARSGRVQDTEDGLSEFPHVTLSQARVHSFFLEVMRNAPTRLAPHYSRRLGGLTIDSDSTHPVSATVERTDPAHQGQVVTVKARYVVGCDGAHSTVRKALGRPLRGDSANKAWGVMDVLAVTDFPDIRIKSAVRSLDEGTVLIIPREGGYLVRLYIELDELSDDERVASRNITPDHLIAAARRILHPYSLDVKEVPWWSVYEIGQRLCDRFDDLPDGEVSGRFPRVFIAGDACHTHSPKAGQGMNVSMRDSFNLGWKLAAVLRRQAGPPLLRTYSAERHAVARELIDFDREFASMFSARPQASGDDDGVDPATFQDYFVKHARYTAGTATRYAPSMITAEANHQHLAKGLVIGMRFHSAPVIRLADAKPMQLGHVIRADGRWRVFAFAGADKPTDPSSPVARLCDFLERSPQSPVRRYTPVGADIDAVIDVRVVFQQHHRQLALEELPRFLFPRKGRYGLVDYEKVFCPSLEDGEDVFDMRGIDRANGCVVVVRPDQYIADVHPLDRHEALSSFFDGFMLPQ